MRKKKDEENNMKSYPTHGLKKNDSETMHNETPTKKRIKKKF